MLVYMLQESIREIRAAEGKEKLKKDAVYRQAMNNISSRDNTQEEHPDMAQEDAAKNGHGNMAGISVNRNGESFKMANIAEVKLNFSEEEKKAWTGKVRPSCAVKPMIKAPKPSATVKPFIKSEGLGEDDSQEKGEKKRSCRIWNRYF